MTHPLCLLRSLWRSLRCGAWVSGHEYHEAKFSTPPNVQILECRTCGAVSIGWGCGSIKEEGNGSQK